MYSIRDTHECSELFTDSDKFDPDRWAQLSGQEKFHFLPFGVGSRACVGKEFAKLVIKVCVGHIVGRDLGQ